MDSTTETLARYVTSLRYDDLTAGAIREAKRHIVDTLGCAMGGYRSEPAAIARRLAAVVAGYEVFGGLADQAPLKNRGWDQGVFVAPAATAGVGVLLELTFEPRKSD